MGPGVRFSGGSHCHHGCCHRRNGYDGEVNCVDDGRRCGDGEEKGGGAREGAVVRRRREKGRCWEGESERDRERERERIKGLG